MTKLKLKDTGDGEGEFPERPLVEDGGTAKAVLLEVEERESNWNVDDNDPSKGKKREVNFKFQLTDPMYQDGWIWGTTPTTFSTHPDCKLRQWVEELLAVDLDDMAGFELDLDDLVGCEVYVIARNYTGRDGKQRHAVQSLKRIAETEFAEEAF